MQKQDNRREGTRTKLRSKLKLSHPTSGDVYCYTIDISDHGIGLEIGEWKIPPIGSQVTVQIQNLPIDGPIIDMVVVRISKHSLGLKFINLD